MSSCLSTWQAFNFSPSPSAVCPPWGSFRRPTVPGGGRLRRHEPLGRGRQARAGPPASRGTPRVEVHHGRRQQRADAVTGAPGPNDPERGRPHHPSSGMGTDHAGMAAVAPHCRRRGSPPSPARCPDDDRLPSRGSLPARCTSPAATRRRSGRRSGRAVFHDHRRSRHLRRDVQHEEEPDLAHRPVRAARAYSGCEERPADPSGRIDTAAVLSVAMPGAGRWPRTWKHCPSPSKGSPRRG